MKLGLIGTGNMGAALLRGALLSDSLSPADVFIYNRSREKMEALVRDYPEINVCDSAEKLAAECDVVLLAVKPQGIQGIIADISEQFRKSPEKAPLFISVAAGVSTAQMEESGFDGIRVIRVMPNTPALIGEGTSAFCLGKNSTGKDAETVTTILEKSGFICQVPESSIDAVAAISGCGPAYMYVILDSLGEAGVALGLPRPLALELAARTMLGSSRLVLESGRHPMTLRDEVTSPGGTTIEALNILDKHGLRNALIEAVKAAFLKSSKLNAQ